MATIDIETLLQPVGPDDPAGPDLEYDPEFLAAFQAAEGVPERQMGATLVPAEEPDWRQVEKLATGLLDRSKDLRVAVLLARAAIKTSGLPGLAQALSLIQGFLEQLWDHVHPQLDPTDDNDPTGRVNVLVDLCSREAMLDPLRTTTLIRSRVFGPLAYRDIEVAGGKVTAPAGANPLDMAAVNGAFQECDPDDLARVTTGAAQALAAARGVNAALAARIPASALPDLDPLIKLLSSIGSSLAAHGAGSDAPSEGATGAPASDAAPSATAASGGAQPKGQPTGEIANRDDVVRTLQRICDYYSRNEPSSPVPLLLMRAQRLVNGSFVDIVRDLAPEALSQVEKMCGLEQSY